MVNSLQFSKTDYLKATDDYRQNWSLTDKTLYSLCQNNFPHDSMGNINAKLWIIGRAYATGIERKIKSNGYQGDSLSQLAKHIYENKQVVNNIFDKLQSISKDSSLTVQKLEMIISLHGRFVELIKEITREKQSSRSFVSKYMHFHCPIVPIYDSIASQTINKFVRWHKSLIVFDKPDVADENYFWFTLRFWKLYGIASEAIDVLKVKDIDCYLLYVAGKLKGKGYE